MLTIVYDPDAGHAVSDGRVAGCAKGAVDMALEFGRHRITTSTGLLIEAIVEEVLARDETVDVALTAYGREWALIGSFGSKRLLPESRRSMLDAFGGVWLAK